MDATNSDSSATPELFEEDLLAEMEMSCMDTTHFESSATPPDLFVDDSLAPTEMSDLDSSIESLPDYSRLTEEDIAELDELVRFPFLPPTPNSLPPRQCDNITFQPATNGIELSPSTIQDLRDLQKKLFPGLPTLLGSLPITSVTITETSISINTQIT